MRVYLENTWRVTNNEFTFKTYGARKMNVEINDAEEYQPLTFKIKRMTGDKGSVENILTILSNLLKET